jgi:5-methylcytosine-specific restriction endonuclease McrA
MPIDFNSPRQVGKPGWRSGLHIDHFVDISLGGPDTLENVRPSHGWCNLTKTPRGFECDKAEKISIITI